MKLTREEMAHAIAEAIVSAEPNAHPLSSFAVDVARYFLAACPQPAASQGPLFSAAEAASGTLAPATVARLFAQPAPMPERPEIIDDIHQAAVEDGMSEVSAGDCKAIINYIEALEERAEGRR